MKITAANIVTALDNQTVGTKVKNIVEFSAILAAVIKKTDFQNQSFPGQAYISCPELVPHLYSGVGRRSLNPKDYVARLYRGRVELFLKRECAANTDGAAVIVYTREAYLNDPDVQNDSVETKRIQDSDFTHILVAVLAFAGPKAPLLPYRLIHNLAGGNNEALNWSADQIRIKAKESLDYDSELCVVAD